MNHTKKHLAWLLVLLLDIVLDNVREGAIASLVSLYDLPTLLIDYDNMIVLVDYLHQLPIIHYQLSIIN